MTIKSLKNIKFKDALGVYEFSGRGNYALYVEGKGFVSLDGGKSPYSPQGGKKALESILATGFCGEVDYIQPVA